MPPRACNSLDNLPRRPGDQRARPRVGQARREVDAGLGASVERRDDLKDGAAKQGLAVDIPFHAPWRHAGSRITSESFFAAYSIGLDLCLVKARGADFLTGHDRPMTQNTPDAAAFFSPAPTGRASPISPATCAKNALPGLFWLGGFRSDMRGT